MEFYLLIDGKKTGPHAPYDINGLVRDKVVDEDSKGWHTGMDAWKPLGEIPALDYLFKEPEPLEKIRSGEEATDDLPSALPKIDVCPWRRLVARLIDTQAFYITFALAQFKLGYIDSVRFYQPHLFTLLSIYALWIFIEAILLAKIGTTPGKALLSLRIVPKDPDKKLTFDEAFKRSIGVWLRGFGIGFLPAQLFCGISSYFALKSFRTTPWDVKAGTNVIHGPIPLGRIILIVFLFMGMGHLLYSIVGEPPMIFLPPRGEGSSPLIPES